MSLRRKTWRNILMSIRNFIRWGNKETHGQISVLSRREFKGFLLFLLQRWNAKLKYVYMLRFKWTFSSYPKPLFQNEAKWEAIVMKTIFYSHANKIHFDKKGFTLSHVWKEWRFGNRKLPILSLMLILFLAFVFGYGNVNVFKTDEIKI